MSSSFFFSEIEIPAVTEDEFKLEIEKSVTRINQDLDRTDYDVEELRELLDTNGIGDYTNKDEYTDEAVKDVVRDAVKRVSEALICCFGEIGYRTERGRSYAVTGGMSHGDFPSEQAEYFDTIIAAGYSFVDESDRCGEKKPCSRRESFLATTEEDGWKFCPFCGEHLKSHVHPEAEIVDDPESQF
jgi:hypothetical protein